MTKTALLFAGQGAQTVGMGKDLIEEFASAKKVYDLADEVLGFSLSEIILDGPKEKLDATDNAQPAVLTMGLAVVEVLKELGALPNCDATLGLSLGEYGAHVVAGSMTTKDAIKLVRKRGELMQAASIANPGTMASVIGGEREAVAEACKKASSVGIVQMANFNSPGQIVISGEVEAVKAAGEACKELGAKRVIPLAVAGAFHTPLMQMAADGLKDALVETNIESCKIPVVANSTADYVTEAEEIRATLLTQLTGTVRFQDSIEMLVKDGYTNFIEVGPGKVLTGLLRRIDKSVSCTPLGSVDAIKTYAENSN